MSDYEPVMPAVQPCASLLSLPTELLLTILTSRSLTLIDLTVLSSTCSTLRPLAHTAASKHRARKVLAECLGFAPGDCLSVECWSDEMIGREMGKCLRPWEVFVPVEELLVEDIISLATYFSMIAKHIYVRQKGYPSLCHGSLPGTYLLSSSRPADLSSTTTEFPPESSARAQWREHQAMLFSHAMLYAALRSLNRRTRNAAGRAREAAEYAHLTVEQREARLVDEYRELRAAIMRCDPLGTHVEQCRTVRKGQGSSDCACADRTWATWWGTTFHYLTVRYRRFMTPSDIDYLSYRTIYFSVPSFPSSLSTISAQTPTGTFSAFGATPTQQTSTLLDTHLNPDSILFSLGESPTFAQTKRWFGLSEHALAPGLARLWAGWIGYNFGEGGALWTPEARANSEARSSASINLVRGTEGGSASHTNEQQGLAFGIPGPNLRTRRKQDDASLWADDEDQSGDNAPQPAELVLLTHARWRARMLCGRPDASDGAGTLMAPTASSRMAQATAFDVHFVRRAMQIQLYALQGFGGHWPGQTPTGGSRSGNADATDATTDGAESMGGNLAGQVHPSSPFLAVERMQQRPLRRGEKMFSWFSSLLRTLFFASLRLPSSAMGQTRKSETPEEVPWLAISAPLRVFLPIGDGGLGEGHNECESSYKSVVLSSLGDLHTGLLPDGEGAATTGHLPLCTERTDFVAPIQPSVAPSAEFRTINGLHMDAVQRVRRVEALFRIGHGALVGTVLVCALAAVVRILMDLVSEELGLPGRFVGDW